MENLQYETRLMRTLSNWSVLDKNLHSVRRDTKQRQEKEKLIKSNKYSGVLYQTKLKWSLQFYFPAPRVDFESNILRCFFLIVNHFITVSSNKD